MSSKIEWTEVTVNTITGCTKYSEGCKNCYAEKLHKRLAAMGQEKYKLPFEIIKCHNPITELSKKITKNVKMCFVNSMSDTFHKEVSDAYIYRLLQALWMYGNVNFQVLTKRASRLPDFEYPDNIWLGTTVELAEHKNRIEFLKKTNAKIKFLSCEPLLGDLGELDLSGIDWVIVGGESGCGARAMHPDWVRNIQKQCKAQNVAFFFKQWGEWIPCGGEVIKGNIGNPPEPAFVRKTTKYGKLLKSKNLIDFAECKEYPKAMKGAVNV